MHDPRLLASSTGSEHKETSENSRLPGKSKNYEKSPCGVCLYSSSQHTVGSMSKEDEDRLVALCTSAYHTKATVTPLGMVGWAPSLKACIQISCLSDPVWPGIASCP